MEKNDSYMNDLQYQNLAYRAALTTPNTVHLNTKQSKNLPLPLEEVYVEPDAKSSHRINVNLHQQRMINKGKYLSFYHGV